MKLILGILCVIALVSGGWIIWERLWDRRLLRGASPEDRVPNLRAVEAERLLREEPGALALDVRPAASWGAGHLPAAVNAPFPMNRTAFADASLEGLDRECPVLVYCDGGFRSRLAIPALRAAGFRRIHHLHRGLISWRLAGFAVERAP